MGFSCSQLKLAHLSYASMRQVRQYLSFLAFCTKYFWKCNAKSLEFPFFMPHLIVRRKKTCTRNTWRRKREALPSLRYIYSTYCVCVRFQMTCSCLYFLGSSPQLLVGPPSPLSPAGRCLRIIPPMILRSSRTSAVWHSFVFVEMLLFVYIYIF